MQSSRNSETRSAAPQAPKPIAYDSQTNNLSIGLETFWDPSSRKPGRTLAKVLNEIDKAQDKIDNLDDGTPAALCKLLDTYLCKLAECQLLEQEETRSTRETKQLFKYFTEDTLPDSLNTVFDLMFNKVDPESSTKAQINAFTKMLDELEKFKIKYNLKPAYYKEKWEEISQYLYETKIEDIDDLFDTYQDAKDNIVDSMSDIQAFFNEFKDLPDAKERLKELKQTYPEFF